MNFFIISVTGQTVCMFWLICSPYWIRHSVPKQNKRNTEVQLTALKYTEIIAFVSFYCIAFYTFVESSGRKQW